MYPRLYEYTRGKKNTVAECWKNGEWCLEFVRSLSPEEADQWESLMNEIEEIKLTEESDTVTWALEKSGQFTTRSMYRMLAHRGGDQLPDEENLGV